MHAFEFEINERAIATYIPLENYQKGIHVYGKYIIIILYN